MRYKRYLTEADKIIFKEVKTAQDLEDIRSTLEKECWQYLKLFRKGNAIIQRYPDFQSPGGGFYYKTPRKDRMPLSTPRWIHEILDEWFFKKFGWHARSNALFGWLNPKNNLRVFEFFAFPTNGFKYIYSPEIDDLYPEIGNFLETEFDDDIIYLHSPKTLNTIDTDISDVRKKIFEFLDSAKYKNRDAYGYNGTIPVEIMINCKKLYLLARLPHTDGFIKEILNLR